MAKQTINIGSTANDGTGDPLRTAFNKANENFTEVYDIANSAFNQANSVYLPSVTRLNVTNDGSSAYLFDQYSGNNPTIKITAGETISFNLNVTGHPFLIRESSGGTNYNTGLTHVSSNGTITTDASAQGKVSGTLYWKVPAILAGNNYVYQCQFHSGMVGVLEIKESNGNPFNQNLNTSNNVTFNEVSVTSNISGNNINANASFGLPVYATEAARDGAITSPQPGMMVYVSSGEGAGLQVRGATQWNPVGGLTGV